MFKSLGCAAVDVCIQNYMGMFSYKAHAGVLLQCIYIQCHAFQIHEA